MMAAVELPWPSSSPAAPRTDVATLAPFQSCGWRQLAISDPDPSSAGSSSLDGRVQYEQDPAQHLAVQKL
jgi:hypothetical protein